MAADDFLNLKIVPAETQINIEKHSFSFLVSEQMGSAVIILI